MSRSPYAARMRRTTSGDASRGNPARDPVPPRRVAPDDGSADLEFRARLVTHGVTGVLGSPTARLLIAVIPDLQASTGDAPQMAAATMVNASGQRGLLAFTGLDSLTSWRADARPMPMTADAVARLARANGCVAMVIDVLGPQRVAVVEPDLQALAQGAPTVDTHECR